MLQLLACTLSILDFEDEIQRGTIQTSTERTVELDRSDKAQSACAYHIKDVKRVST